MTRKVYTLILVACSLIWWRTLTSTHAQNIIGSLNDTSNESRMRVCNPQALQQWVVDIVLPTQHATAPVNNANSNTKTTTINSPSNHNSIPQPTPVEVKTEETKISIQETVNPSISNGQWNSNINSIISPATTAESTVKPWTWYSYTTVTTSTTQYEYSYENTSNSPNDTTIKNNQIIQNPQTEAKTDIQGNQTDKPTYSLEFDTAFTFMKQYGITEYESLHNFNAHEIVDVATFKQFVGGFINTITKWRTDIIPYVSPTKGNFVTMILSPLLNECQSNSCILEYAVKQWIIADSTDLDTKSLTKYDASLILWRTYLVYSFMQEEITPISSSIDQPISLKNYLYKLQAPELKKDIVVFPSNNNITSLAIDNQKYSFQWKQSMSYGTTTCNYQQMLYGKVPAGYFVDCFGHNTPKRMRYGSELFDNFGMYIWIWSALPSVYVHKQF